MGALDLKKLSKGMHILDKMKLLFEDTNRQAETDGKESVLTPQEREAIITDARKNGEINEIRRVHEFYVASTYIGIDMEMTELSLHLAMSYLERILLGMLLKSEAEEIVSGILYDLVSSQGKKSDNEFEKEIKELREKYRVDRTLFKGFEFFTPTSDSDTKTHTPNAYIQQFFMMSFPHARQLKKKLFMMEYIKSQVPIDFLSSSNKKLIDDCNELITTFTSLDSSLNPLRIYCDYGHRIAKGVDSDFLSTIRDLKEKLELTDVEKDLLKAQIDKRVRDNL
ncbi:MAG TPA: hypothetical protein VK338_00745 [Candidatus Nitrosocosmicus sp.]|nr:hypothetical protein [Candidatus Nitrosocosmicus sp.]